MSIETVYSWIDLNPRSPLPFNWEIEVIGAVKELISIQEDLQDSIAELFALINEGK